MNVEDLVAKSDVNRRTVLELSNEKAKRFFLKPESYFSLELPPYISFDEILAEVAKILEGGKCDYEKAKKADDVNYIILSSKDGKYAWRPFQLIHPVLYVELVNQITKEEHWECIVNRFDEFSQIEKIKCYSLPIESSGDESDKAEQISRWVQEIEQRSIQFSLKYEQLFETDITNYYGSIYTHSISWAIHTKPVAKKQRRDESLIGNTIDKLIQSMQHGQTNGIPQGSVLMDFVAEIILGYVDLELSKKIASNEENIGDFYILRYRDDYRIFVNDTLTGENIIKLLTEVLIDLGLALSSSKTKVSKDVIQASIKDDKLGWMVRKKYEKNLQKHLLIIHDHSKQFPNSGSIEVALKKYYKRILNFSSPNKELSVYEYYRQLSNPSFLTEEASQSLISIIADIAYRNPRTYLICCAILSKLLEFVEDQKEKEKITKKIKKKFSYLPNTGYIDIWLQRATFSFYKELFQDDEEPEPICKLVSGENEEIWNNDWLQCDKLKEAVNAEKIIDREKLTEMESVVQPDEVPLFWDHY